MYSLWDTISRLRAVSILSFHDEGHSSSRRHPNVTLRAKAQYYTLPHTGVLRLQKTETISGNSRGRTVECSE